MSKNRWLLLAGVMLLAYLLAELYTSRLNVYRFNLDRYLDYQLAATMAYSDSNYPESEKQLLGALEEAEKKSAANDFVVSVLSDLGRVYIRQKKYADAERVFMKEVNVSEQVYGVDNEQMLRALNDIAGLYADQGRLAEAERFNQRALVISARGVSDSYASLADLARFIAEEMRRKQPSRQ